MFNVSGELNLTGIAKQGEKPPRVIILFSCNILLAGAFHVREKSHHSKMHGPRGFITTELVLPLYRVVRFNLRQQRGRPSTRRHLLPAVLRSDVPGQPVTASALQSSIKAPNLIINGRNCGGETVLSMAPVNKSSPQLRVNILTPKKVRTLCT